MDFETFRENLARDIKRNIDAILGDELKKPQNLLRGSRTLRVKMKRK